MIGEKLHAFGLFLAERLHPEKIGKGNQDLQQDLSALFGGGKIVLKEYYARKILMVLAILAAGVLLSLICFFAFRQGEESKRLKTLSRPGYGEGDRTEDLSVRVGEEDSLRELEVTVQERKYTDQERQEFLDQVLDSLDEILLGENESPDYVQEDLVFPESFADGLVSASWSLTPADVIGTDGHILKTEETGTIVEIRAVLSCGDLTEAYECSVRVFPPDLTGEERLLAAIREEVKRADEEEKHESELVLPASAAGEPLTWLRDVQNPWLSVLAMTLLTAICSYLLMDSRVHDKAEKRRDQLLLDYPDLMWKMTMLLGAGMSLQRVFVRIAEEYAKGQKKTRPRYVYEEVIRTCNEMKSGIGEAQAYERFGRRCQLPAYIRIGSVLSQNLRKGSRGLTALLESEAEASLNDRKNHARKIGEQAGTRLLLPMGLMLIIVLAVLMMPAFLSM